MIKIYVAGPFFSEKQLDVLTRIETVIESIFGPDSCFKPRDARSAAKKLNADIGAGKDPSAATRHEVFCDNVDNIDDADLMVAITDGRDSGTLFEHGYAYAQGIPIITYTDEQYGLNLMLAESVLAHCKGETQLRAALTLVKSQRDQYDLDDYPNQDVLYDIEVFEAQFKRANLVESKEADKNSSLYKVK